jgi:hypothetical protein
MLVRRSAGSTHTRDGVTLQLVRPKTWQPSPLDLPPPIE